MIDEDDDLNAEGQPTASIEKTLAVVSNILLSPDFAEEVVTHNDWKIRRDSHFTMKVGLLFLTSRYQWAVELLSQQTATLKAETDELRQRVAQLENSSK